MVMSRRAGEDLDLKHHLRVLFVTTSFPTSGADLSGIFVYRLSRSLIALNTTVTVLAPSGLTRSYWPASPLVRRFRYAPSSWQRLAHQPGGIPVALANHPQLYVMVPQFLIMMGLNFIRLARHCDLIHAHWSISGALAVLLSFSQKKPVITTLRGSDVHRAGESRIFAWLQREVVHRSDFTVGVSHSIVAELKKDHPNQADGIEFVPNGVDDLFYSVEAHRSHFPPSPLKILYIGSLIPLKGLDVLLHALAKMPGESSWTMTLAGNGPERRNLSALASTLKIGSKVRFMGLIRPDKIHEVMSDHHLLVLPSHREGRPNVVLEAMAAAMPVVGTDIDGTRELVREGLTGWLVPPGDEEALAQVLMSLVRGEKDLTSVGMRGRQWMLEQGLTWNETACLYRHLYLQALYSRGATLSRE
jgi:glycosyltransferase involved in cell wall biosynthesis